MRTILQVVSISMLVLTVLLPALYLADAVSEAAMKWSLLLVTVIWFLVTPFWMGRQDRAIAINKRREGPVS